MPIRPPAAAPAGRTRAPSAAGRGHGRAVLARGPLRLVAFLSCFVSVALAGTAVPAPVQQPSPPRPDPVPEWRRTDAYRFPALADTVRRLQHVAHAVQLREYCADRRVPDDFVRERLQRFGQLTGREEDCASLVDY